MKKIFLLLICSILMFGGLNSNSVQAISRNTLPLDYTNFDPVLQKNVIHDQITEDNFEAGTENVLKNIFRKTENGGSGFLVQINIALGAIALVWLVVLGSKFIVARGDEEKLGKYKTEFGYMTLGFVLIGIAEFMAWEVLNPAEGNMLEGISAFNFDAQIKIIIRFVEFFILGIALIKMMMAGYDLLTGGEEEETISREKEFFRSFFFGATLILMAETLIRILSPEVTVSSLSATEAATLGIKEFVGIINFILSFLGVIAVIMLILSSLYYVISFGSEDQMNRAKRIIISCVIGLMIAISSYTLVAFVFK